MRDGAGFSGILQVDGYGGYRVLADKSGATLALCWAQVRRCFYELAAAGPAPTRARRFGASQNSIASRMTSAAGRQTHVVPRARKGAGRSWPISNPSCVKSSA